MANGSLRSAREALMNEKSLTGEAFCRALSDATDAWLCEIADQANHGGIKKIALLAVGGYGRQELCPFSDLDLLLVYESRGDIKPFADALWYPVWDEGVKVDHAVRRPKEVLKAASKDLRVALGLLDARLVWGDPNVVKPLLEKVKKLWREELAAEFLPQLEDQMEERHRAEGDVAFLLEPNLKESHGGLRDVSVLRSLPSCAPLLEGLVDLEAINAAASTLVEVRVELHRAAGRELDRMLLQEQDQIATLLGFTDADQLCRRVSEAGRTIARLSDETWRRRRIWEPGSTVIFEPHGETQEVEEGIVIFGGEVTLAPAADVGNDSSLIWRLAAVGAEHDLPISLGAVHRLADQSPPPPVPWTPALREALVRLLLAGPGAIRAFESLDQVGLVTFMIPEWEHVRHYHQRNAYHRFTVDRHLLEAASNASELVGQVDRPDLLVLGALFHDIGKGLPGDHTEVGIELVGQIGPRLGLDPDDVGILQDLVRHHLLLADTATRRDLSDPRTIETVARAIPSRSTLHILGALTKADSLATGSSAWGAWKEQLVDQLVARTDEFLAGANVAPLTVPAPPEFLELIEHVLLHRTPSVMIDPPRVVVAALDRPGLLADVAGTLALHRLDVLSADVASHDGVVLDTFSVGATSGRWPTTELFEKDLTGVLEGTVNLEEKLANQATTYAGASRTWSARPMEPSVRIDNEASQDSTVLELRASDRIGLLHQLTSHLFSLGLDVMAARVATVGGDVVDSFYVRTPTGEKLSNSLLLDQMTESLLEILGEPG